MNKVHLGIAGIGGMGRTRAKWLSKKPNVKIVAFCDVSEKAKETASQFKAHLFKNYSEFLKKSETDAVVLSVPNKLHSIYTIQALQAGKHVLVEYPIATEVEEAEQMLEIAAKKNLILHPGHTMRFEPDHLALKQNLFRIGKMVFTTAYIWYGRTIFKWYGNPELRGDTFTFLNYHHIDQFRDLFGEVEWVDGILDEKTEGTETFVRTSGIAMLNFVKGGCAFTMQGHGLLAPNDITRYIVGENGYLELTSGTEKEKVFFVSEKRKEEIALPDIDPYKQDTDNFINEITGKIQVVVSPEEALKSLKVCKAAFRSAQEKKRIYL